MAEKSLVVTNMNHILNLFGSFDENIRLIQDDLNVTVITRGADIKITGNQPDVEKAYECLKISWLYRGWIEELSKAKKKDEKTGEEIEVEDYDWDKITKAVKSFVEDYNDVVKEAGESNTKDVLRNASWMTGMTDKNSNMLAKIGITIGKGNKLELDEDALKQADISSLKTVFTGYNSFVSKISQKATGISNAANRASATYTNNGTYSKTDSSLTSSKIDKEV